MMSDLEIILCFVEIVFGDVLMKLYFEILKKSLNEKLVVKICGRLNFDNLRFFNLWRNSIEISVEIYIDVK
jgi:hypothetical protein